jgi:hypothetical protein
MKTKIFKTACWRATASRATARVVPICLLLLLTGTATLSAQNGVTVSDLAISAGTVTFNVSWNNTGMPAVWSDTVWVFVDYNKAGKMERLPLSAGATLTATSAPGVGKVKEEPGNDKGVWVVGNARTNGSFSATVQLLTAAADFSGACVYGSNYPPVGKYVSADKVTFTGTPPYDIVLNGGGSVSINGSDYPITPGVTIASFTDKTGAPGTFHCIPPAAPAVAQGEFCYEQPGTLVVAAAENVVITWYDAATEGILLHTGEVLSLPPLYNTSAQYYAQAMSAGDCLSSRTKADYTVSNCAMSGDCPGFTAGNIDAPTAPAACVAHYVGQIGSAAILPSCMAHDPGRIGRVKN